MERIKAMERIVSSPVDEARKFMLAFITEKYPILTEDEEAEFKRLTTDLEESNMRHYMTSWEENGLKKGIEKGILQGVEIGVQDGILQGQKRALLRLMHRKFGELPVQTIVKLESVHSNDILEALQDKILDANTLDEMGLNDY